MMAEDSLPLSHPARLLWTALGDFDRSAFVVDAKAVDHTAGRRVYSTRMILTLWGYALSEGRVRLFRGAGRRRGGRPLPCGGMTARAGFG